MKITQEADYAFRIVLFLSKSGSCAVIDSSKISDSLMIPKRFTLKILRKLTKGGLTKSFRGVSGGYTLNKEPTEITFREVIEVIDGPICLNRCLYDQEYCNLNNTGSCEVHHKLQQIRDILIDELEKADFKTLLESD